ncbi:MAG TPA: hypothetical protein VH394_18710 [Thermoanaerobaculia bacterium]|nr:hypothetical protein [Thermoanaerobaculia bacterium]
MNVFVPAPYLERVTRLALGFEPLDAVLGGRLAHPVRMEVEGALPRVKIDRHDSCLHVLLYQPSLADEAVVRIRTRDLMYAPRRLRIPLLTVEEAETRPYTHRVRRPVLFPGAAYDATGGSTGLRGRVMRDGSPMRWARVEARLPGGGPLIGRAHGDARGEFLLLLASPPAPAPELTDPFDVQVAVFGPADAPEPGTPDLPSRDDLWDLPVETLAAPGDPDPTAAGETLPDDYVEGPSRVVPFRLGRVLSGVDDFEFV